MAMCGAGDTFESLSELLLAERQWLRLHRGGVPLLALQDRRGQELAVNAWALDYFKHGQKSELMRANGMLEGDAWAKLKSMSGVLSAISTSLQTAVGDEPPATSEHSRRQQAGASQQRRGPAGSHQRLQVHKTTGPHSKLQQPQMQAAESAEAMSEEESGNREVAAAFQALSEAFALKFKGFNTGGAVVVHGAASVGGRR